MEILERSLRDETPEELAEDIASLQTSMGITEPARTFLESCLLVDQKFIVASLLTESTLPIEHMFGVAEWGRHLQARLFTRQERHVTYYTSEADLIEMVQAYLCERLGQKDSPYRGYTGGRGGDFFGETFLPIAFTPQQLHGLRSQRYPTFLSAGDPGQPNLGYIKYPDMHPNHIRSAIYSTVLAEVQAAHDPYWAAAHLQQNFVGLHPAAGGAKAVNGRISRVLMHNELEKRGCHPSILPDFDLDLYSTPQAWRDIVAAGSQRYGAIEKAISNGQTDPIALLGLTELKRFHDEAFEPPPDVPFPRYTSGAFHTHAITDTYLRHVCRAAHTEGIQVGQGKV